MAAEGDRIGGRYRLLRKIGKGGMAEVWMAEECRSGKKAALKELRRSANPAEDAFRAAGLRAEAALLEELHHPGIPRFLEFLELPEGMFLVMEYVEGRPLDRVLREEGPLPAEKAREILLQTAEILRVLHGERPPLLHRDIKPSNLILGQNGRVYLIDFGSAERQSSVSASALGTKGYAAPEQAAGGLQDARTDLYALGTAVEHLLTGRPPRGGMRLPVLPAGREKRRLLRILRRLRQRNPERRIASAAELIALVEWQAEGGRGSGPAERWGVEGRRGTAAAASAACILLAAAAAFAGKGAAGGNLHALPAVEREEGCLRLIRERPEVPGTWQTLLELYLEDGQLDQRESGIFLAAYHAAKGLWTPEDERVWRLCSAMARAYLLCYTGGDGSFRSRLFMALPYFQNVADYADPREDCCVLAGHLCRIAECCRLLFSETEEQERGRRREDLGRVMKACLEDPAVRGDREICEALREEWQGIREAGRRDSMEEGD